VSGAAVKAVVLDQERRLALEEVSDPTPQEGQTLVEVRAAGVNYADVLIREGRYPQAPPLPFVPGSEIAGETPDGRRVIAFVRSDGGGYAEKAVADDDWLFDLPKSASFEEGAAFLLTFLTAWIPLTRQVRIAPGARVLVTAAAGGVGSAGVQVARALGAEVVGAVGSAEKAERVRALGAADAVTYEEVGGLEPFDVILDQVGGELFSAGLKLLRPLGTIIGIGFAGGAWQPLDPALLVGRNVSAAGFYLGRFMKLEPFVVREAASELLGRWSDGEISPVVGATYPLAQADEALRLVAERRSTGKVVLLP
jgi:NADPH2:quinone reductase